jgi:hypothetical protein
MNYKICSKCKKEFKATYEFFVADKRASDGLQSNCRDCGRKVSRRYYRNNKETCKQRTLKWQKDNKERCNKKGMRWKKKNPDKLAIKEARRRARKRSQCPSLTDDEKQQIIDIYKNSKELGSNWQVDHIMPLAKGGLHHPDNLQIVLKEYNQKKGVLLNFRPPSEYEICKEKAA